VSLTDSDYTQVRPTSFHADLTVILHGRGRGQRPVMGIIVEVQLRRDPRKRRSWPLYAAALHARLGCQTCLVVIAPRTGVARWAAEPIDTLQPDSPFTPLVIGPEQIPRVSRGRARRQPWLALLSTQAHGNSPGGVSIALATVEALHNLPVEHANVYFDRIRRSLNRAALRALEHEMQLRPYVYKSDFARRYFGEGRKEGREVGQKEGREVGQKEGREVGQKEGREVGQKEGREVGQKEGRLEATRTLLLELTAQRFGLPSAKLRPIKACDDLRRLTALFSRISAAPDRETAERLVAAFGTRSARATHHRPRRARPARAPRARAVRR
jgi:hypothetical protein